MPPRARKTPQDKLADMVVERVPIDKLQFDPENPREHDARNLAAIAASFRRFGQRKPLVVSRDYTVVAGNGSLQAMTDLGWDEVWVSVFPGNHAEAVAFGIADNRSGELASWNPELLMKHLNAMDHSLLEAAGYDMEDLSDMSERFSPASGLDELTELHGEPDEMALWPVLRIQLPKPILDRYHALTDALDGDEVARFTKVIEWAEETRIGSDADA